MLGALARMGGLNVSEKADTITEGNKNVGGKMVFTRDGMTINEAAEKLSEAGFIPPEHQDDDGVRWLQEAIQAEYSGRVKHYAIDNEAQMEEDRLAAQGDEPPPPSGAPPTPCQPAYPTGPSCP